MADRYWVGGAGTWNTTSTTNWSTASGGSSGASVPTAAQYNGIWGISGVTEDGVGTVSYLLNDVINGLSTF